MAEAAALTPAACGRWVFTWNAFRIECNPDAVLETVQSFDLEENDLCEGSFYLAPDAAAAAVLTRVVGSAEPTLTATLTVDPNAIRRKRAEADLILAELNGKPLTPNQAQSAHAGDVITGTIAVSFVLDAAGQVAERRTVTQTTVTRPATPIERGVGNAGPITETRTVTEVIERRLIRTIPPATPPAGSARGVSTRPG